MRNKLRVHDTVIHNGEYKGIVSRKHARASKRGRKLYTLDDGSKASQKELKLHFRACRELSNIHEGMHAFVRRDLKVGNYYGLTLFDGMQFNGVEEIKFVKRFGFQILGLDNGFFYTIDMLVIV